MSSVGTTRYANAQARLVRMTLSFSKSEIMHEACLLLFLHRSNHDQAILLKGTTTCSCTLAGSFSALPPSRCAIGGSVRHLMNVPQNGTVVLVSSC